ncbi:MAG: histidine phosphatase family protein [Acidimicrobiia bacterium]|nr:histidine phosphatase family protein [Acidimicrobiia bacterium]
MDVFLIRHAHAGSRTFGPHDLYRQLTDDGHRQAKELASYFASLPLSAVYSSPATRCTQTVEPTARAAGLSVVEHEHLWEDAGVDRALELIDQVCAESSGPGGLILCSHGNLIPAVVERLSLPGIPLYGRGCERASIWRLRRHDDRWTEARYLTPRSAYGL